MAIEKNKIEKIITGYCQGNYYLEFQKDDFPEMIAEIKAAIINELDDAEHLDDARQYVRDYL